MQAHCGDWLLWRVLPGERMMTLKYMMVCVCGLVLGWFGYDFYKAAFTAIKTLSRARDAVIETSRHRGNARRNKPSHVISRNLLPHPWG